MARLLVGEEWYEGVASESLYEIDFSELLIQRSPQLYPQFYVAKFNTPVRSEFDGEPRTPDLALIEKNYRSWWVVEVELGNHPLREHVERQVRVFSSARYGAAEAQFLARKNPHLDPAALAEMMRGGQPRVLVIVNAVLPAWSAALRRYDAQVAVAEMFRSARNDLILRINGEQPDVDNVVTRCHVDAVFPWLVIDSPAGLGIPPRATVQLESEGGVSEWTRTDSGAKVWLIPSGRNPLSTRSRHFVITRSDGGRLKLKPTTR